MRFEAEKAERKYSKKSNPMETEWSLFHGLCSFFYPDSPPWLYPNYQRGSLWAQAEKTDVTPVSYSVPRGKIYDTYHKLVVYNISEKAIVYPPPKIPQPGELLELAKKLNTFLVMTDRGINKVTDRDLKDIWLLVHNYGTDLIMKRRN
ncbi:hypothetical protein ACFVHQ_19330 [Actinomycetes bacterium NPDC127524]